MYKIETVVVCDVCGDEVKKQSIKIERPTIRDFVYIDSKKNMQVKDEFTKYFDKLFAVEKQSVTVIFTTNQTDGGSCPHYLSNEHIHLCRECNKKLFDGNMIYAYGCMGYNTYYFKKEV